MKSLHQWCKKEVLFSNGQVYVAPIQQQGNASSLSQSSIDTGIATSSYTYFKKLFHTVLYLVEEEIAFTKLKVWLSKWTMGWNLGQQINGTTRPAEKLLIY